MISANRTLESNDLIKQSLSIVFCQSSTSLNDSPTYQNDPSHTNHIVRGPSHSLACWVDPIVYAAAAYYFCLTLVRMRPQRHSITTLESLSLTLQLWAIQNWSLPRFSFSLRNLLLHTATCCRFLSETNKPYGSIPDAIGRSRTGFRRIRPRRLGRRRSAP